MIKHEQLDVFCQAFPQLAKDKQFLSTISNTSNEINLPEGQHICLEGDQCTMLALVLEGTGRVYKLGESGREITLYRVEPGDCCILTLSCILGNRQFPAFAISETSLKAIVVPEKAVQQWMNDYSSWREYAWNLVAERLSEVISLVEEVTFRRMDERLNGFLQQQPLNQTLTITHQQIAAELGTSREVISRLLKDKQQKGQITLGRGWIQVKNSNVT